MKFHITIALVLILALVAGTGNVAAQGQSEDGCLNAIVVQETVPEDGTDGLQTGVDASDEEGFPHCTESST